MENISATCGKWGNSIPPLFPFLRLSWKRMMMMVVMHELWCKMINNDDIRWYTVLFSYHENLFFTLWQFEREALEELVHQELLTTPPSGWVLIIMIMINLIIMIMILSITWFIMIMINLISWSWSIWSSWSWYWV